MSDLAIFVLKRDVKLQLTNFWYDSMLDCSVCFSVPVLCGTWALSVGPLLDGVLQLPPPRTGRGNFGRFSGELLDGVLQPPQEGAILGGFLSQKKGLGVSDEV